MIVDKNGIQLDTLSDILDACEIRLQAKYGADFHIKPEGVIDNIFTSAGFMEMSVQEQLAFLFKQLDPETAEGVFQDWIYERQGCYRLKPSKTTLELEVAGAPNVSIAAGEITIRDTFSNDEFINTADVTTDENGTVKADFECVLYGDVSVADNAEFLIVTAPDGITAVTKASGSTVAIGSNAETDEDYRIRFRNSKSINAKATHNANFANLLKLVSDKSYLKIKDKKTDSAMEAGTLMVIANHNTTDSVFAAAIFDTIAGGIDTIGNTTLMVQDDSKQYQQVKFQKAGKVLINIQGDIKIMYGKYPATVIAAVKNSILNYAKERVFGLESVIYATEFIIPALQTDGVEAFTNIKVKRSTDLEFADNVQLKEDEVAEFTAEGIILNEDV